MRELNCCLICLKIFFTMITVSKTNAYICQNGPNAMQRGRYSVSQPCGLSVFFKRSFLTGSTNRVNRTFVDFDGYFWSNLHSKSILLN